MNLLQLKNELEKQAALIAEKLKAVALLLSDTQEPPMPAAEARKAAQYMSPALLESLTNGKDTTALSTRERLLAVLPSFKGESFQLKDLYERLAGSGKSKSAIYFAFNTLIKEGVLRAVAFDSQARITRVIASNEPPKASSAKKQTRSGSKTRKSKKTKARTRKPLKDSPTYVLRALASAPEHQFSANDVRRHLERKQKVGRLTLEAAHAALKRLVLLEYATRFKVAGSSFVKFTVTPKGEQALNGSLAEPKAVTKNPRGSQRALVVDTMHSRSGEWSTIDVAMHLRNHKKIEIHPEAIRHTLNKLAGDGLVAITKNNFGNVRYSLTDKGNQHWKTQFQPSLAAAAAAGVSAEIH